MIDRGLSRRDALAAGGVGLLVAGGGVSLAEDAPGRPAPSRSRTVEIEEATNIALAVSPDGRMIAFDLLGILWRSEEHKSELQSLMRTSNAGFCLKKKKVQK